MSEGDDWLENWLGIEPGTSEVYHGDIIEVC
jgi:hypothetical protein